METVPALETEGEVQGQDQQENQEEEKSYFDEEASRECRNTRTRDKH